MEITQIYAIVAGGVFLLLMFMKGFPFIQQVLQSLNINIQVSHLSIGRATSPSFGAVEFRRRSASALLYLT